MISIYSKCSISNFLLNRKRMIYATFPHKSFSFYMLHHCNLSNFLNNFNTITYHDLIFIQFNPCNRNTNFNHHFQFVLVIFHPCVSCVDSLINSFTIFNEYSYHNQCNIHITVRIFIQP